MNSKNLMPLFEAIGKRQWSLVDERATALARAADAEGKHALSRDLLRQLSPPAGAFSTTTAPRSSTLFAISNDVRLADVALPQSIRDSVRGLIVEHKLEARLREHALEPRRKILFHGPPGCGKTLTAQAIAGELGMPAFIVQFDLVLGSLLGQTSQRLHDTFLFATQNRAVVILDEIDALARHRGDRNDVGEIDRALVALLQGLEHSTPAGLIVASTNVPNLIDRAVWRRFDSVLSIPRPTQTQLKTHVRQRLERFDPQRALIRRAPSTVSLRSYAEADKSVDELLRASVLRRAYDSE